MFTALFDHILLKILTGYGFSEYCMCKLILKNDESYRAAGAYSVITPPPPPVHTVYSLIEAPGA